MYPWVFVLVLGVILGIIVRWLFIRPAEIEFKKVAREAMEKQALKRQGKLTVAQRMPALIIPYKKATIDLGYISNEADSSWEYTYARFRTDNFPNKKFSVYANSKDFFTKPLAIGTRVELVDERLREKFVVTGNDAAFVNDLLTDEVREKLLQKPLHVKFGRRIDSSTVSRERGWLTVFTQGNRAQDELFDALIETASLLYERLEVLSAARE